MNARTPFAETEAARQPLFRPEAVAEQQDRWLGPVVVAPPISQTCLTLAVAAVLGGILWLLAFGEYTQKVRLSGVLVPQTGLIEIVAPQGGVVVALDAGEGDAVAGGTPLLRLSGERRSETVGATLEEVLRSLQTRRDSLAAERDRAAALFAQQAHALEARTRAAQAEAEDLDDEADLLGARVALSAAMAERQRDLLTRALTTEAALFAAEKDLLDETLALQRLERQRSGLRRTLAEAEAERAAAPLHHAQRLAEIDRAVAALDQEIAWTEAQREVVVAAPQDGTVTALRIAQGDTVSAGLPLMTLVPAGTGLRAAIDGPSRAIGFVRPGQQVLIRYDAYPYQKFGIYRGAVASVSRAPVAADANGAAPAAEPTYRIAVTLASQTARAYGAEVPLQPGMRLQADILIETRPLYRWILDPLHALTGGAAA